MADVIKIVKNSLNIVQFHGLAEVELAHVPPAAGINYHPRGVPSFFFFFFLPFTCDEQLHEAAERHAYESAGVFKSRLR